MIIAGSETAIRAALARPVAHASGLGPRLWHDISLDNQSAADKLPERFPD
jgi:hypothetical protein